MNQKIFLLILGLTLLPSKALAQINADTSLGLDSSVVLNNQSVSGRTLDIIIGGQKSGSFLIHSFDTFSIPKGKGALFIPNKDIKTIISRVTSKKSNLNGFLGIQGSQNLIFVNPNGIQFDSEFQSGISGSIIFSNSQKIKFGKTDFLSTNSKDVSILNKSINEVNFVFEGSSNSEILVKDSPKTFFNSIFIGLVPVPIFSDNIPQGFTLFPKQNISLIADKIRFDGGIINSTGGKIDIYSISDGAIKYDVNLNKKSKNIDRYGDISLNNLSNIIDFSDNGSSLSLFGKNIQLSNGSFLTSFSTNPFQTEKGSINVTAENIAFSGISNSSSIGIDGLLRSGILSNAEAGIGSDINVSTINASFDLAAGILSRSNNNARGGDISIKAKNNISSLGNLNDQGAFSGIGSLAYLQSKGGSITIESNSVELADSASIQTYSFDQGTGGNISVFADNRIELRGINNISPLASQIQTYSFSNSPAGNVDITAKEILVREGGGIGSTAKESDTGFVTINAQSIDLSGSIPNTISRSRIFSSVQEQEPLIAELFIRPGVLDPEDRLQSGNAQTLLVNTGLLRVSDDAEISVRNDGLGDAGNLVVNAFRTEIKNGAQITASTKSGNGGNIILDSNLLTLNNAVVTSNAEGFGKGGNIEITSQFVSLLSKSRIEANAEDNQAGRVNIISNSSNLSKDSEILATSSLGPQFDGIIDLNIQNQQAQPQQQIIPILRPTISVADACNTSTNSIAEASRTLNPEIITDPEIIMAADLKQRQEAAEQFKFRDSTGKIHTFRRWLAIEKLEGNQARFIYSSKQSKKLENMISSLDSKCSSLS